VFRTCSKSASVAASDVDAESSDDWHVGPCVQNLFQICANDVASDVAALRGPYPQLVCQRGCDI
jgi:hypothetical protein